MSRSHRELRNCRTCGSYETIDLKYYRYRWYFPFIFSRSNRWQNVYCYYCGAISHYPVDGVLSYDYSSGDYRDSGSAFSPPLSLPWSAVTYERSNHVSLILSKYIDGSPRDKELSILDYGGYTGLLAYGVGQRIGASHITVADFDVKGLRIAESIGCNTVNLKKTLAISSTYDIILLVHVLEHVEDPGILLGSLYSLLANSDSVIYVEVPNIFSFAHNDEAHLSEFSVRSLHILAASKGLSVLESGFISSPKIVGRLGYPFRSSSENIYLVLRRGSSDVGALPSDRKTYRQMRLGIGLMLVWSQIRFTVNLLLNLLEVSFYSILKLLYSLALIVPSMVAALLMVVRSLRAGRRTTSKYSDR